MKALTDDKQSNSMMSGAHSQANIHTQSDIQEVTKMPKTDSEGMLSKAEALNETEFLTVSGGIKDYAKYIKEHWCGDVRFKFENETDFNKWMEKVEDEKENCAYSRSKALGQMQIITAYNPNVLERTLDFWINSAI
jgi:hypothetical protein